MFYKFEDTAVSLNFLIFIKLAIIRSLDLSFKIKEKTAAVL